MMLSPSAARLGTSIRLKGKSIPFRHYSVRGNRRCDDGLTNTAFMPTNATSRLRHFARVSDIITLHHHQQRCKSTASAIDYENEEASRTATSNSLGLSYMGHAAAAEYRLQQQKEPVNPAGSTTPAAAPVLASESWRINLGRGSDNAWLMGPRNDKDWFTGIAPNQNCPGTDEHGVIRSLPLPNLSNVTRENALEYFNNSWTLYETLFAGLKGEEGFYRPPPHGLRHPQIFYYGHTACLYINKLRVSGVLSKPVNPYFESIFEVGVDEMLWDDMHKNEMLWPLVSEVNEYRQQVYEVVKNAILTHPSLDDSNGPVTVNQKHPMWALFMGYEHERIHLETSSVLFRETPFHLVQMPKNWPPVHPSAYERNSAPVPSHPVEGNHYPNNEMLSVQTTDSNKTVDLGKPADFPSFGWDNEYGERNVDVPSFMASKYMISNGEFYQFVIDGGYRTQKYWSNDGWSWRTYRNLKQPYFWENVGPAGSHEYALRTIFDIVNMPWDWPVDVTYYEAKAFCNWKNEKDGTPAKNPYRLLTEAEHHLIRHKSHNLEASRNDVHADKVMVNSGRSFIEGPTGANLNLAYSSQNPVNFFTPSETGHYDTTGSAWEWTEDHFNPLKGFEVHHVYDDFSTPCFDGKHSMIVGGSFISTGDEASVFARFHFRPHFLQHSGFRLVASDFDAPATHLFANSNFDGQVAARDSLSLSTTSPSPTSITGTPNTSNVYETDESLHMYYGLHYSCSGSDENVPPIIAHDSAPVHGLEFPQRVVDLLNRIKSNMPNQKYAHALDIGCAVGGASFELGKRFDHVDAFDFSASFVNGAKRMQTEPETVRFRIPMEADIGQEVQAIHNDGITPEIRSKVNFFTGDACQLDNMVNDGKLRTDYDGVIMSNLLCRLPDPVACLNGLSNIVNTNGVVVMVTPFSWLTEYTSKDKWLGGFYDPVTKQAIHSKDVLRELMEQRGFIKIHEEQVPLLIREHQRKYQYIVSEATGWRKEE